MKKHGTFLIICFVVLMFALSFVSASSISSATYDGQGLSSFMGGAYAQPGSNINHNSSFSSTIEINISDCKDKLGNFSDASSIKSIDVTLKDSASHTETLDNKSITVDSAYIDGDILHITIKGEKTQSIHSSEEISKILNFDNATVNKINIDTGDYKLSANA